MKLRFEPPETSFSPGHPFYVLNAGEVYEAVQWPDKGSGHYFVIKIKEQEDPIVITPTSRKKYFSLV